MSDLEIGATYTVACPFLRDVHSEWDEDGKAVSLTWKPGVEFYSVGPYGDESKALAHGVGSVVYRLVDIHRLPRPYPPRAFYTRQWVSPEGKTFGKTALRITTLEAFKRRVQGYRVADGEGWEVQDLDPSEQDTLLARAR